MNMLRKKLTLIPLALFSALSLFVATVVFARPAFAACDPQTNIALSIKIDGKDCIPKAGAIMFFLKALIKLMAAGVGIAVVGGIVWGGIMYMTAQDSASQTQKAITIIVNSLIGLLMFILLYAIVNFLVPGGVLT